MTATTYSSPVELIARPQDRPAVFLLWSGRHRKWWLANGFGYTDDRDQAGRFSRDQAVQFIVQSSYSGDPELVSRMVWTPT